MNPRSNCFRLQSSARHPPPRFPTWSLEGQRGLETETNPVLTHFPPTPISMTSNPIYRPSSTELARTYFPTSVSPHNPPDTNDLHLLRTTTRCRVRNCVYLEKWGNGRLGFCSSLLETKQTRGRWSNIFRN